LPSMRRREKRHSSRPFPYVTLAAAVQKALGKPKISRRLKAAEIAQDWEAMVGDVIASHVQPVSLERGLLTLKADSSVWRQQITLLKPQLLDRISSQFSRYKVRELRVI